jgi:predicted DNA binding CopG/RHH family protein/uncharacterized protein YwgA
MSMDSFDALLDQDWSEAWESLPEAPALVPRAKTGQITLRVSPTFLARLKRAAAALSLPYHALARSWIVDGLRGESVPDAESASTETQPHQMNLKVEQVVLDALKARAQELRRPYHRLARELIASSLVQQEARLGLEPLSSGPAIKDLMVLLLHATDKRGESAVRGMTRLQKLLFVIEQKLASQSNFYAFNYGPFNEEVNDAAHALQLAGFMQDGAPKNAGPPSFAEMMATVSGRAAPRDVAQFELNEHGHDAAERLLRSDRAYSQLYEYIRALREEWDTPDLVERVYEAWPKYAEKSLIREEVAARRSSRRRGK